MAAPQVVEYCHTKLELAHRDIKPENILMKQPYDRNDEVAEREALPFRALPLSFCERLMPLLVGPQRGSLEVVLVDFGVARALPSCQHRSSSQPQPTLPHRRSGKIGRSCVSSIMRG